MNEEVKRNYMRNKSVIDLELVPDRIKAEIMEKYTADNPKDRSQLLNYFIKNKLRNLMESISEF